mmetsp:Transcript_58646/g.137804  ORF Transcript_58646/g.137804 Transcript_58646/m.137804 type:complete len:212 (-) Transcript_58646:853-1488(-)
MADSGRRHGGAEARRFLDRSRSERQVRAEKEAGSESRRLLASWRVTRDVRWRGRLSGRLARRFWAMLRSVRLVSAVIAAGRAWSAFDSILSSVSWGIGCSAEIRFPLMLSRCSFGRRRAPAGSARAPLPLQSSPVASGSMHVTLAGTMFVVAGLASSSMPLSMIIGSGNMFLPSGAAFASAFGGPGLGECLLIIFLALNIFFELASITCVR